MHAIINQHLLAEVYPPRKLSEVKFDFFKILMRGIFQSEMALQNSEILQMEGYMAFAVQARKLALIKEPKSRAFVVNHLFLPGHSQNSGVCLPNETELWIQSSINPGSDGKRFCHPCPV